jgi:hypothetical protein
MNPENEGPRHGGMEQIVVDRTLEPSTTIPAISSDIAK